MSTPHHGKPDEFDGTQSSMLKRFAEQVTGQYQRRFPDGRMGAEDDGDLTYAIVTDKKHKTIIIRFAHATEWVGLGVHSAIALRDAISRRIVELQTLEEVSPKECP